jgi:hypothetical protein
VGRAWYVRDANVHPELLTPLAKQFARIVAEQNQRWTFYGIVKQLGVSVQLLRLAVYDADDQLLAATK